MQSPATVHFFIIFVLIRLLLSIAVPDTFIYVGCSPQKYSDPSDVQSLLTSLISSASYSYYSTFNISSPPVYGLFQCRGDLSNSACHDCVSAAVTRLGSECDGSCGGALQLEGCFVRYDNASFVGIEDKTLIVDKCGPAADDSELVTRKDAVLSSLMNGGEYFRVAGVGRGAGIAQCVQDLSVGSVKIACPMPSNYSGATADPPLGEIFSLASATRVTPRVATPPIQQMARKRCREILLSSSDSSPECNPHRLRFLLQQARRPDVS